MNDRSVVRLYRNSVFRTRNTDTNGKSVFVVNVGAPQSGLGTLGGQIDAKIAAFHHLATRPGQTEDQEPSGGFNAKYRRGRRGWLVWTGRRG